LEPEETPIEVHDGKGEESDEVDETAGDEGIDDEEDDGIEDDVTD